jgi:RHS repeat-associated protein
MFEGGVTSLVRTDHIGRPVFATGTTGVKTWTASYTPFGGVRTTTGTPISARFPGQWFQAESGLHQNWMRDYDPTTGRYLQADPLGLVDGASVYGYAGQSPMMNVDPRGELFGPLGALAGGLGNLGLQLGINMLYGNMSFLQAMRCVNWSSVANGAAFGALGGLPIGMVAKGALAGSARQVGQGIGVGLLSTYVALSLPKVSYDDECECDFDDAPAWVDYVKTLF